MLTSQFNYSVSTPFQFKLTVPKTGGVGDLCEVLSQYVQVKPEFVSITSGILNWWTWSVMTTHVLKLLRYFVTSLTTSVTTMYFLLKICPHKVIKSYFKSHMMKRILHEWSFHMKFIKLVEGSFNEFHMK